MSPTRERLRRAASVVVLLAGFVVLVATGPPPDDTSEAGADFDDLSFDGATQMLAGRIDGFDTTDGRWSDRAITISVETDARDGRYLVEMLDPEGRTLRSTAGLGPDLSLQALTSCQDDACRAPVDYRIHRIEGGRVTMDVGLDVTFTATTDEEQPDVAVNLPAPGAVEIDKASRPGILATRTFEVGPGQPVSAALVSWRSASCAEPPLEAVVVRSTSSEPTLRVLGRGERTTDASITAEHLTAVPVSCSPVSAGRKQHAALVVLAPRAAPVSAEVWFVGPPRLGPVEVEDATVRAVEVGRFAGPGGRALDRRLAPSDPDHDGFTAFLLDVQPVGDARVRVSGSTLEEVEARRGCGRCAVFHVDVRLDGPPGSSSDDVAARAVAYEIQGPGS